MVWQASHPQKGPVGSWHHQKSSRLGSDEIIDYLHFMPAAIGKEGNRGDKLVVSGREAESHATVRRDTFRLLSESGSSPSLAAAK